MKSILLFLILTVTLFASPADSLFVAANALYEKEQYDSAATLYSESLRNHGESSAILFNLGNCSFRLGQIGEAILYTERAARLAPNDKDIRANLEFLRTQITDELPKKESNPIADGIVALHNLLTLKQQLVAIFLLSLLVPLFTWFIVFRRGTVRIWAIYGAGTVLLAVAVLGTSAGIKIKGIESVPMAIILDDQIEAYSEPTGAGELIFTAHEGTKLTVLSSQGTWSQVALPNGVSGFVREKSLGRI